MSFTKKILPLAVAAALPMMAAPNVAVAGMEPFLGEMNFVGFNFAPRNWASCDGAYVQISENSALFALLGTTFGGDGRINFALPDMRGRVPVHRGQGPGVQFNYQMGERGGMDTFTLTLNQLPTHNHTAQMGNVTVTNVQASSVLNVNSGVSNSAPDGKYLAGTVVRDTSYMYTDQAPNATLHADTIDTTITSMDISADINIGNNGASSPVDNRSPYLVVNCIIALQGNFPSRN